MALVSLSSGAEAGYSRILQVPHPNEDSVVATVSPLVADPISCYSV